MEVIKRKYPAATSGLKCIYILYILKYLYYDVNHINTN